MTYNLSQIFQVQPIDIVLIWGEYYLTHTILLSKVTKTVITDRWKKGFQNFYPRY